MKINYNKMYLRQNKEFKNNNNSTIKANKM